MHTPDPDVKPDSERHRVHVVVLMDRCRSWIDSHPRTGWYIAILTTINVVLNLVQIFH